MLDRKTFFQFVRFGCVGAIAFVLDSALVYFNIYELGLGRVMAGLVSFPFSVTFTWAGNRYFTFRHTSREKPGRQFAKFITICAIGLVFNRGTYSLLVTTVPIVYAYPVLGLMAGTGVAMFFNFFVSKKLVFR